MHFPARRGRIRRQSRGVRVRAKRPLGANDNGFEDLVEYVENSRCEPRDRGCRYRFRGSMAFDSTDMRMSGDDLDAGRTE